MLKGKTAFITGTNRGLGKAFVEMFAKNGADVVAHARKDSSEFRVSCSNQAEKYSVKVMPVFFDLTDSAAMKTAVRELIADKTPINVLVNSAGIAHGGLFQMTAMAKVREVFDVNLFAQMELTQLLFRYMMKSGGGSIVNIASISGLDLKVGNCAYGVSKAALIAFTRTLAAECGTTGLRVNAVCPGLAATDMRTQMDEKAGREMIARSAMNRLARPEEIARVAVFLASDEASFVNGQILSVDGGRA